jgi:hypothetical protein
MGAWTGSSTERVQYVADPERERMHLQSEFVNVLHNHHPGLIRNHRSHGRTAIRKQADELRSGA